MRVAKLVLALVTMVGIESTAAPVAYAQTAAEKAFIETGDAICKTSNQRLAAEALKFERHTLIKRKAARSVRQRVAKPTDVAEFVSKIAIKEIQGQLDELGALTPSKELAKQFAAAMDESKAALARMKAKPEDAAFQNPFAKSAKMFSSLGFKSCGQTESASEGI